MTQRVNRAVYVALIDKSKREVLATEETDTADSQEMFTVTAGSLTYDFSTDTKVSGKVTVAYGSAAAGEGFMRSLQTSYIRLYANKAGGKGKKLVATCLPSVKDMENTEGVVFQGSIELKSTLCALTENQLRKTTLKKGTNLYKRFKLYAANYACTGLTSVKTDIGAAQKKLTLGKNKSFDAGTSTYEVMSFIAKKLGCYITVDATGRIFLKSKSKGASKHRFSDAPGKALRLTSSITVTDNGTPTNRCLCYYERTESKKVTRYWGKPVRLASSDVNSKASIGRHITKVQRVDEEELKQKGASMKSAASIRGKLTLIAKEQLRDDAEKNYSYKFKCPYVDTMRLRDRATVSIGPYDYSVRISAFDIDLLAGCEMTVTATSSKAPKVIADKKYRKL